IRFLQTEVVPHSGRNIETRAFVQIEFRAFIAKHVLPMVSAKWSCIFPLCISCPIAFADCDPSILGRRDTGVLVRLFKPRNDPRRFGPMASMCFVVVGKCTVKWV